MGNARKARVAVIGAGPAGLVVAHELLKEGHDVTVFEASSAIGGAWQFDSSTDSDLLGLDPLRHKVHSSMYLGLRSNLPRHIMTFLDFPFLPAAMGDKSHDTRVYPLHSEILAYLEAFADRFQLHQHIKLNTRVLKVDPVAADTVQQTPHGADNPCNGMTPMRQHPIGSTTPSNAIQPEQAVVHGSLQCHCQASAALQWKVTTHSAQMAASGQEQLDGPQQQQQQEWLFDAVVSCVGIFSEPNLPQVPGMNDWPGLQVHSHNYRNAKMFIGMKVLVVGASFSGEEIARHIAREAQYVYQSARTFTGPGTTRESVQHTQAPMQQQKEQQQQLPQQHSKHNNQVHSQVTTGTASAAILEDQHADQKPAQNRVSHPQLQLQINNSITTQQQQQQQQEQEQDIPAANEPRQNITRVPLIQQLLPDGSAVLQGGRVLQGLDAVVYCTGYKHSYSWLEHLNIVQADDMHVRPLYLHMFPPAYAPNLCFIGLPWRCAKVPQFQLQGQLLARVLSGRAQLPSLQEMQQDQQQLFTAMSAAGIPRRYTHCLASCMPQNEWQYAERLANMAAGARGTQAIRCTCNQQGERDGSSQSPTIRQVDDDPQVDFMCACQQQWTVPTQTKQQPAEFDMQAMEQQQKCGQLDERQLLVMPGWLENLGRALGGSILGRPDTFRDTWDSGVQRLLQDAEEHMMMMF